MHIEGDQEVNFIGEATRITREYVTTPGSLGNINTRDKVARQLSAILKQSE